MARRTVTLVGFEDALADIARAAEDVRRAAAEEIEELAHEMADDMRQNVPVASGDLQHGIDVQPGGDEFTFYVGIFEKRLYYVQFVEYGTSLVPARPFMVPAAEVTARNAPQRVSDAIRTAL